LKTALTVSPSWLPTIGRPGSAPAESVAAGDGTAGSVGSGVGLVHATVRIATTSNPIDLIGATVAQARRRCNSPLVADQRLFLEDLP
jgi:hypothetical protein